jgi:hypothetical protein
MNLMAPGLQVLIDEAIDAIKVLREENAALRSNARQQIIDELREAAGADGAFGSSPAFAAAADFLERKELAR